MTTLLSTQRLLASCCSRINTTMVARRGLSTQGQEAVGRLKDALEQYRAKNYQQEIPSRFRKELVGQCHRHCGCSNDRSVTVKGIEQLLSNIGIFGTQITHDDVETIVSEFKETPADKILNEVL